MFNKVNLVLLLLAPTIFIFAYETINWEFDRLNITTWKL